MSGVFDHTTEDSFIEEIIKNASFESNIDIQNSCIELVYIMCCNFLYLPLMIVNSQKILNMVQNALFRLHPDIFTANNQKKFLEFHPINNMDQNSYYILEEGDLMTNLTEFEKINIMEAMEDKKNELLKGMTELQKEEVKNKYNNKKIEIGN